MKTPIADFINEYGKSDVARFHMPGHKGGLGFGNDITEICGADDLFHAEGIIAESEANATELFGSRRTFYSTEGSSLCIRAMLFLALEAGKKSKNERPFLLAGRNAHKTLVMSAALLDFDIDWMFSEKSEQGLCGCEISGEGLEKRLLKLENEGKMPFAVFVTSPNYLGRLTDVKELVGVCHRFDIPLLVDNAHGAYLKFLKEDMHPMELGADMCCDSAHKTLPALTGTAYLHVGRDAVYPFEKRAKEAMSLFGSTSPSYLLLESLDRCNAILDGDFRERLAACAKETAVTKEILEAEGFVIEESEALKIVINAAKSGANGEILAEFLRKCKIEPEYADYEYVVLMTSPYNKAEDFEKLHEISRKEFADFCRNWKKEKGENFEKVVFSSDGNQITEVEQVMSIREAVFAESESVKTEKALGRVCGMPVVSCPPAVPIVAAGERIGEKQLRLLELYGHKTVNVIK